jgi:tRNA pseudouridine13 synthase
MNLKESPEFEKRIGIWFYSTRAEGIGGEIKRIPVDFFIREITNRAEGDEGKYLIAELTKQNWDTHSVVREISNRLRVSRNRIGFAGTKDKFAVTTQKISIWDTDETELERVKIADVSLKPIGRSSKAVSLGDLYGNEFKIVIRDIIGRKEEVAEKIAAITTEIETAGGIPNFFGVQRFGVSRPITHVVEKHLIRGNIKDAVLSYITDIFPDESEEAKQARSLCKNGDLKECLKQLPLFLRYERSMLNELIKRKSDNEELSELQFLSAFYVLPKNLQKLFVHAYQAYLFNLILSQRMKQNLPLNEAVVGDVVCFHNERGLPDPEKVEKVTEDKLEGLNRLIKRGRAFVTAPIFGSETEFADGLVGEIERVVLKDEAIELSNFYIEKQSEISSKGTRRPVLVPVPVGLNAEISEDELNTDRCKAELRFFLPKGSYATVLLREYMKK